MRFRGAPASGWFRPAGWSTRHQQKKGPWIRCHRLETYNGGFTGADLDMSGSFGIPAAVALALAEARDTQISDARLDDQDRIAFDMHDHVMGELFALGIGLQGLAAAIHSPAQVAGITTYVDTLDRVISTIRTTIFQLQPRRHDPAGLQTRILGIADARLPMTRRPVLRCSWV
jgi:signal transduction histidine kinase